MKDSLEQYNILFKTIIKLFPISEKDRYGRENIKNMAEKAKMRGGMPIRCLDIAAGGGTDLLNIRNVIGIDKTELYALEAYRPNVDKLRKNRINVRQVNIERDRFPLADGSMDIIVANQILEHCKELWWIFSEMSRVLKPGGYAIIGVPNLASLHCRAMLLIGRQPTCIETHGPHIRGFTYKDLRYFIEDGGYFEVAERKGSGFYSIIPGLSGIMARLFPGAAVNMTLLVRRTDKPGLFIENLLNCRYETNFYNGRSEEDFIS